jgi:hypothetical protein
MERFENVDVIASLDAIMRLNTAHYQSEFKYDAGRHTAQHGQPKPG